MKWEVFYTEQAETDLRNVFEYIAFTLLVPETAKKQVQRIMKEIAALDNMPFRYKCSAWLSLNCYPLFVLFIYSYFKLTRIFK